MTAFYNMYSTGTNSRQGQRDWALQNLAGITVTALPQPITSFWLFIKAEEV